MRSGAGSPLPLGATWTGAGVNFAVVSEHAARVELCLFDRVTDAVEHSRVPLARTGPVWHAFVPDVRPGQLYGYRADGPWDPLRGLRFNHTKVLFDPYGRVIGRTPVDHPSLFAYETDTEGEGAADPIDSARYAPLAAVHADAFDWQGDRPPGTAWADTIIYELHVRGLTAQHPAVPHDQRGTFLGVASPPVLEHLMALGITAVELMPVQAHADEWQLARARRTNYWGYNTFGFFAPDPRFAASADPHTAVTEFKQMVRALHAAGIEVLLDVVYNHTAEGDHLGPHLSLRGLDNVAYYRLDPTRPARYENFSGCGNTLDLRSPLARQLVLDSLRYWIEDMHVDGFRFDLATALARGDGGFDAQSAFLRAVQDDPVLSRVKLIAEPWDAAHDGFQLGRFPPGWSEWNAHYRDTVRRFWRGDPGQVAGLATRLAGSSDLFAPGRSPHASINYVTAHDGFTLADLVAYNDRHNEANGEGNRDGESRNFSWNGGAEGPVEDQHILSLRRRQQRNLLLTLFTSLGVPMLSGGDEMNRTQMGNNNAYNQDSPLTWTPWDMDEEARALVKFTQRLTWIRAAHPTLRQGEFLSGAGDPPDVRWLKSDGREMTHVDWHDEALRTIGWLLPAADTAAADHRPRTLLVLLHAGDQEIDFVLPEASYDCWDVIVDTSRPDDVENQTVRAARSWRLLPRSAALLRPTDSSEAAPIRP